MKKRILELLIPAMTAALLLAGCGLGEASDESLETEDVAQEASSEPEESQEEDIKEPEKEPLYGEDLYEAFMNGEAQARYQASADHASYLETAEVLKDGEYYTLDQIIDKTDKAYSIDNADHATREYHLIDCGSDGNKELLADIGFAASFRMHMVLKDYDGELVICYICDGGDRFDNDISDEGYISFWSLSAANIHTFEESYLDANGIYHFFYGVEETISPYSVYFPDGDDYIEVSFDDIDTDHLLVKEYWMGKDEHEPRYCVLAGVNDDYEQEGGEEFYEEDNPVRLAFEEAGISLYEEKEIFESLQERADEIGYKIPEDSVIFRGMSASSYDPEKLFEGATSENEQLLDKFLKDEVPAVRRYVESETWFYNSDIIQDEDDPLSSQYIKGRKDLDNDGEDELMFTGGYGDMYLDAYDGEVFVMAEGEGTALVCSNCEYEGLTYVIHRDVSHSGRKVYIFDRYDETGEIVESFRLEAFSDTDQYDDEHATFTFKDKAITAQEFEELTDIIYAE
jgi:hypothetical protein